MRPPLERQEAERLVETYSDLVLRLSYSYLNQTQDAQDICQTVFLKLLERAPDFVSSDHEKAWIIRTTANTCLYFLFSVSSPNYPLPSGGMSLTLRNLCSYGPVSGKDEKGSIPLVEGTWDLSFHLEYDTSTLSLPTGQTFHHGPLTGTVEEIRLSPISIYLSFRYTFEEETLAAGYDPGATELSKEAWLEEQKREWFSNLPLYVTFPDGTTQDIQQDTVDLGGFSQGSVYTLSGALQTVLPLDSIASFHLGDLTIPLPD